MKVLLAEDGLINQRVAINLLEMLGHTVTVAVNGREAVAAWQREPFDVVLMDVHMPEMDGFDATAAIRREEQATGRHTPIIALTANAMLGDRDRCLTAGMDGYLSKPVTEQQLRQTLEQHAPASSSQPPTAIARTERNAVPLDVHEVFDLEAARQRIVGGMENVRELADLFRQESAIAAGRASRRPGQRRREARAACGPHAEGLRGHFLRPRVVAAAQRMENLGREQDLQQAAAMVESLETEVAHLLAAIDAALESS